MTIATVQRQIEVHSYREGERYIDRDRGIVGNGQSIAIQKQKKTEIKRWVKHHQLHSHKWYSPYLGCLNSSAICCRVSGVGLRKHTHFKCFIASRFALSILSTRNTSLPSNCVCVNATETAGVYESMMKNPSIRLHSISGSLRYPSPRGASSCRLHPQTFCSNNFESPSQRPSQLKSRINGKNVGSEISARNKI